MSNKYIHSGKYIRGIIYLCSDCNIKIGVTKTGRCRSCASKYAWKNKNDRSLNLKHGHYSIHNKSDNKCLDCDKKISPKPKHVRCHSCENKHRFKVGIMNTKGKNNGQFIHGMSKRKYPKEFNKELKVLIFKRDNYTCQKCEIYPTNKLSVHHIDYNKFNTIKTNLITLCRDCNSSVNTNRDYWFAYFTSKLECK